jgi:GNAT superfamily N-acetyltransferase
MRFITLKEQPSLLKEFYAIEKATWGSLPYLDFGASFNYNYFELIEYYNEHQIFLLDDNDYPISIVNSLPISKLNLNQLPDDGWDWALEQCFNLKKESGQEKNLVALSISVPPHLRNQGIATKMILKLKEHAKQNNFENLIAPVRPSLKQLHPDINMEEYINWKNNKNEIYDPWLRTHIKCGGEIINICKSSMTIIEPINFWKLWVDNLNEDGTYIIPGGLVPLQINNGMGIYQEPGIWINHSLK